MISQAVTRPLRPLPQSRPLSDRLRAWAEVATAMGQRLEDPPAVLRILTEGVRRVLGAEFSVLFVTVETGVLEVRATSGFEPDHMARLEAILGRPFVGARLNLVPGGALARAYFERADTFVTEWNDNQSSFIGSASVRRVLQQLLNMQAQWNLPLVISPVEECVGVILLGRATREPPDDDDHAFASAFVAQAAVAIRNSQLYEAERRQRKMEQRQRSLAEAQQQVTATVGIALELPDVAARVLTAIVKLVPCDAASLFLRYGDVMRVCAVHNLPADVVGAEYTLAEPMLSTRSPVWLDDAQADARGIAAPEAEHVRGWLAAPLVVGERTIGQVSLGSAAPACYGEDDAELLQMLARQAALALENAQLYSEATRRLQQMATLNEISNAALMTLDFEEVARRLGIALRRTLRYESLTLWMATDSGGQLFLRPVDSDAGLLPWGHGLVGQAAAQGRSLSIQDARQNGSEAESHGKDVVRSQLCVPIRIGERVIGVIDACHHRPAAFNDADVHLLSIVAGQLAVALENARLYAAERRRTEETLVLLDVAEAISSSFDLADMLSTGARRTAQLCRVDMCLVLLLDDDEAHFQLAGRALAAEAEFALDWIAFNNLLQQFDVSDNPRMMETLAVGQPRVVAASELAGPLWQFFSAHTPLNLLMLVPLRLSDRSLGMMILGNYRTGYEFDARQVSLAAAIGRQLAVAVDAERLREMELERAAYLGMLYQVSRSIAATLDPDEVLRTAVREIVSHAPYSLASVLLLDEARGELVQRAAAGSRVHLIPSGYRHPIGSGIIGYVARTGQMHVANDVESDPYFVSAHDVQTGAELAVPLKREGNVIGVLNLEKPAGERFFESEIMAMETLAGQMAAALENAYLYARTRLTVQELSQSLDQLKQAQAQLIQSAKLAAVGQLAAGVAHEINNPLTTISGFSELLLGDLSQDSPMRNDLTLIRREAQRARDVVRRLLDFARQTGPHSEPADMNDVVRETVALMRNAAATKHVRVVENYGRDMPWARLDVNQFKQVVLNLLNNAMQAMPKGGALSVTTEVCSRDRPGVCLHVADTGMGIPAENMERIFEPFFTTKPTGEGTGLGLAVSYGIVREHGGRIEVKSVLNQGTTFTVWLPVEG